MNYPRTYTNARGSVTVLDFAWTFWGKLPCYSAHVRGDPELWFDAATKILQMQEHADGTWTAWYQPGDPDFEEHARRLIELGGWK